MQQSSSASKKNAHSLLECAQSKRACAFNSLGAMQDCARPLLVELSSAFNSIGAMLFTA